MMYISRVKIPAHIYAKYQYMQESKYESTWHFYISTEEYNYKVIMRCDIILQVYYITNRCKSMIYKEIYKYEQFKTMLTIYKTNLMS